MGRIETNFKQTEVGLIPEDWEVKSILSITNNIIDYRGVTPKKLGMDWGKGSIVALSAGNIKKGYIDFNSECYLGSEELYLRWMRNGDPRKDDIAFTMEAPLGNIALIPDDKKYILSQRAILLQIERNLYCPIYVFHYLISSNFQNYISAIATGSTAQGIKRKTFETLNISLPKDLSEQTAIANALSDADGYIESLEKLIDKKQKIKQGSLQQLLKPKPHWEFKCLGQIGEIIGAGVDKEIKEKETPVRLVNYMDVFKKDFIYSNDLNHWVTAPQSKILKYAVKQGDIFFTPSSEMRFDIAISAVAMENIPDAVHSYHLIKLRLFQDWDLQFRTYIFKTNYFLNQAEQICEGSGKRYVITLPKFRNLNIYYPPNKDEQIAIAQTLSDIDNEIATLTQKLTKAKAIKQGMMQQLLTGKIRLI